MMRMADRHLINKCLDGDSSAFGMLVDKYRESVYALAYSKLRNFHDAEDITQEAFIKAYKNLHKLRTWDDFHSWIYAIASNLCKNWIRDKSRQPDSEFIEDQTAKSLGRYSSESFYENAIIEQLHESLDSLPEIYQQVLTLYYLGGMDSIEIAEFLGMSPTSIYQRLSRARSLLKKEMLDMMSETFEQNRLKAGFTFRIAEMIKRIKITPVPPKTLPWGFSLATGLVLAVLSIGTHLNPINLADAISGLPLSGESKVQKIGEIPVDITKVSSVSVISNHQWNGNGLGSVVPSLQNAFFMAPQAGDTWTKKADMPTARYSLSACVVNDKIYAIGGWGGKKSLSTVEEYSPITDKWERKSDKPTPGSGFGSWVIDNRIYTFDTWEGTMEQYEPEIDKWTKLGDMPNKGFMCNTSLVNGKIYLIGGTNGQVSLSTVNEYDPMANTWTKKADMPTPRYMLSTCVNNGKIYAIGGFNGNWPMSNIEEYDPQKDEWTKKSGMSAIRHSLVTCAVNGRIYAIGGIGAGGPGPWLVEEYDPLTDTWTKRADMPTGRWFSSGCVINEKIYIVGGVNGIGDVPPLSALEVYDPSMGQSINFKGKLPTTWGETKTALNR